MIKMLKRVFTPKKYWQEELNKWNDRMISAKYEWRKAIRWHEKSKELRSKYQLARLNYEKAWVSLNKARGY